MRFANKVFLVTFFLAGSIGFGVIWVSLGYMKRQAQETYLSKYSLLSDLLGQALCRLELNAETLMYNAGKVVVLEDNRHGVLSTKRLKLLRDQLNITHLFVVDGNGNFIRSTNEDPKLIPNLFSFSTRYRELLSGRIEALGTPIILPKPEPKPFKFLTLPNLDRTRLIEVGLRVDFIGGMLSKALRADANVVSLNLYTPDGISLGRFSKSEIDMAPGRRNLPGRLPSMIETNNDYRFFSKVPSTQTHTFQAQVDENYYYVLESRVSKAELTSTLASIWNFFFFIAVASLLIAFATAKIVSWTLVRRLEGVISGIRQAKNAKSLSAQLKVFGKDEIAQLAGEFNGLLRALREAQIEIVNAKRAAALGDLSTQVAHDIRSPLAALDMALKGIEIPPERKELVNAATARIRGIAEDLLKKYKVGGLAALKIRGLGKDEEKNTQVTNLAEIIERILMEKKVQYPDIEFAFEKPEKALIAETEPKEFGRIISNLINNSVEAMEGLQDRNYKSKIEIILKAGKDKAVLSVKDNGKGIPTEILSKIGQKGFTYGKESGTGLGLWHAISTVEKWGGNLKIESKLKIGTEIIIELPLTSVPCHPTFAVLIDDDPLMRKNWELSAKKKGISLKIFKNAEDFLNIANNFAKDTIIYIDSELENGIKGEEVAKKIYSLGFPEIYLETGHSKDSFKDIPHIKDIIGKEPPF